MKGCVRAEKVDDPSYYMDAILEKCEAKVLQKIYNIGEWEDAEDFLK